MEKLHLHEYIRQQREQRGLSIRRLAAAAGLDFSYLAEIERGGVERPGPTSLSKLATALELPLRELFTRAGYDTPRDLPTFAPYLRAKYDLPDAAIAELAAAFERVNTEYDRDQGRAA